MSVMPEHRWFPEAGYGLFLHWGPFARWGRGEQALVREMIPQADYLKAACEWKPRHFDARAWAEAAVEGGFKYAVMTTRHHDGFCMFDTTTTEYSAPRQAFGRDAVREYVEAFREAGLKVGLYYSWNDFIHPAFFKGPRRDQVGWQKYVAMVHHQVMELLTHYGPIDLFWFDGTWPWSPTDWKGPELLKAMRAAQPHLLVNNRFGSEGMAPDRPSAGENHSFENDTLGDFGTPEHHITASAGLWESCQVTTWRLWGFHSGERWRGADHWLDFLIQCRSQGGNLLLNVGPDAEGRLPKEFLKRNSLVGAWLKAHGHTIFAVQKADFGETVTFGHMTRRDDTLFLLIRFWPSGGWIRLAGLKNHVVKATLSGDDSELTTEADAWGVTIRGLPKKSPDALCAVIQLDLEGEPQVLPSFQSGLWTGDPIRFLPWAEEQGDYRWVQDIEEGDRK